MVRRILSDIGPWNTAIQLVKPCFVMVGDNSVEYMRNNTYASLRPCTVSGLLSDDEVGILQRCPAVGGTPRRRTLGPHGYLPLRRPLNNENLSAQKNSIT
jgi:hypothetical protein